MRGKEQYFKELTGKIEAAYDIAGKARAINLDPADKVEALPAGDIAARVEGRVGPPGIAEKVRECGRENILDIIDSILEGEYGLDEDERIGQSLRTALDILTEGVVAAPLEGISDVKVESNPDGSRYLSIYFAGPIRSAGGTGQGLAVLIGDYIRKKLGLAEYRPTEDEVERYVEEVRIYNNRVSHLQYLPSDDDIRTIVRSSPVCVDGDPTEKREVSIHRDLKRVETNRIRGGMCLVVAEGLAQKAKGLKKHAVNMKLDWQWLNSLGKDEKTKDELLDAKSSAKFMDEVVGGRPIFAAPSAKGALRLRYGRCRASGIAAKSIHPATMVLTGGFIATGTQVKVERPGKGCIITECDTIEGPIVKLADGSVTRVESTAQAHDVKHNIEEILFLGDLLVSYGDFLQTNTSLVPSGYVEEWWGAELTDVGGKVPDGAPTPDEAVRLSKEYDIPLHPRYTYHWEDISVGDLDELVSWLMGGEIVDGALKLGANSPKAKRVLELLGTPHQVADGNVLIDEYVPLLLSLGLFTGEKITDERFAQAVEKHADDATAFDLVAEVSPIKIRKKVGAYIGCRMGRPEKARERKMQPAVHSLFPIGDAGGRERSINAATQQKSISVEVVRYMCPKCNQTSITPTCTSCGQKAVLFSTCPSCGWTGEGENCPKCRKPVRYYLKQDIDIRSLWEKAISKIGRSTNVKGVKGMISHYKIPEPIEKGLLRAINSVYVFKDGTTRFDATDAPLTHFRPSEVAVSIDRLKSLGYTADHMGQPLESDSQILELKVQDIIIPERGAKYMLRVSRFVDQLLTKFYGLPAYYNADQKEDLLGKLVVGLAPHTSAGIIGRIAGFTRAHVCYAHPFWHAAKRRNADGDEDAFMLLLDVLLNFSRKYLPEQRGGMMDAPLVVTTILNPKEIDDEAHKIENLTSYPLQFYAKTLEGANPSEAGIPVVRDNLESDPYAQIQYTHETSDVTGPVVESQYVKLDNMPDKVKEQLAVAEKIRAISERDVAEIVINSHFLRDTYGNLRAFARQKFRCVKCNASYRRVPLVGKCMKCGGRLLLTVTEGNIVKYLNTSKNIAEKYQLSDYLKQRLDMLEMEVSSLFTNDLEKQVSLAEFM